MLTLAILIFGVIAMVNMPREEFPAVDFGSTIVVVPYPGVAPEEIERLLVRPLETGLANLEDLDYLTATAEEGRASVRVVFSSGVSSEEAFDRVSREVNKITTFPEDALDPIVIRLNMREVNPIAQVVITGEAFDSMSLQQVADNLSDGLLNIDNISKVELIGERKRQIRIDADQARLDAYGLALSDISAALSGRNLNIPAGSARFGKGEFLVRTLGEFNSLDEISSLIVQTDASGRAIRIGDVAAVKDTLEKRVTMARLNGVESVSIFLYKKGDGNIIKVMKEVRDYANRYQKNIPGIKISVRNDGSVDVKNGINALGSNALVGVILVFLALFIFLGLRNAILASFGIPLSILIAFWVIPLFNVTLNNLTIFGFIIVVGMVVDNSIVVLENIHRLREEGFCHRDAIVQGVDQVISPVFSSTLTTIAAFLPLLLLEGVMGSFLGVFPIVVSIALLGSWFQSMVVLPNNIYQFGPSKQDRSSRIIAPLISFYQKAVTKALKHRQITVWSTVVLLILSFAVMGTGAIKFEFFPTTASQTISLRLQTPIGTSLEQTEKIVSQVEEFVLNMKYKDDVQFVVGNVGATGGEVQRNFATSNAQLNIDLVDLKKMKFTNDEIRNEIRAFLDKLPGLYSYRFTRGQSGPPIGNDIELRIKGESMQRLAFIADVVKNNLKQIPGVTDIDDSFDKGNKEVRIIPRHDMLTMNGLSVAQIASAIRMASTGSEVSKYRGEGVDEYPILVKLQDAYTQDMENLKNLKIRTRSGDLIAIRDLAEFEINSSLTRIEHRDQDRVITVTASVSTYAKNGRSAKRSPSEVNTILMGNKLRGQEGLLSNFEQRFPGYTIESGGVQEEQRKSYASLGR